MSKDIIEYDRIYSLGLNCSSKTYMRNCLLGAKRGPFDWLACYNLGSLVEVFNSNFDNFFLKEHLELISGSENVSNHDSTTKKMSKIYDKKSDFYIIHEFPEMNNNTEIDIYYPSFKKKYDGIINNFKNDLKSDLKILFLLNLGEPWIPETKEKEELNKIYLEQLYELLCKYRNGYQVELSVVSYYDSYKSLNMPNITFYTKSKEWPAWGENESSLWKNILETVELKDPLLRKGW